MSEIDWVTATPALASVVAAARGDYVASGAAFAICLFVNLWRQWE